MFERHITEQPPSKLMIGVHDYYELKNTHLYNTLLALINDLCI